MRTLVLSGMMACASTPPGSAQPREPAPGHVMTGHADPHGHHHRFEHAADWAKVFDDPARDAWQKPARVIELMASAPGMVVADVGAGTGYFEPHLSRAVSPTGKVIAEDVEPDMVKWLTDRATREGLANVQPLLGRPDDPSLPAEGVDRILVVDTWHHIDQRRAFAEKLARALKPNGAVFVVDFTLDAPHGPPRAARLPPDAVASDLASAGLVPEVLGDAALPDQYVVRGRR